MNICEEEEDISLFMASGALDVPPEPVESAEQAIEPAVGDQPTEAPAEATMEAPAEVTADEPADAPAEEPIPEEAPVEDELEDPPKEAAEEQEEERTSPKPIASTAEPMAPQSTLLRPRPIGPLEPQLYPSVPTPYHMCDRIYKSTYSEKYKSCSVGTIDSVPPAPWVHSVQQPHPPREPKPSTPPSPPAYVAPTLQMPTFFGEILEDDVTFCVDTSGSMYYVLDTVKDHLIDVLQQRANEPQRETTFNLIDFSTELTQWSNKMVKCSAQTVGVATRWIKKMAPKTGTNTLGALDTAFRDPDCQAVCLVTDGLSDQHPEEILDRVNYIAQNRPVHAYYIQGDSQDQSAVDFLRDLAMETYGSFHIIHVTQLGAIEKVTPVYRASATAERIVRTTSGNTYPSNHRVIRTAHTVQSPIPVAPVAPVVPASPAFIAPGDPFWPYLQHPYYLYPWPYRHFFQYYSPTVGWSRYRPARAFLKQTELLMDAANTINPVVPGPGAMLLGQKVLARKHGDGFFYQGKVKSQIMDNKFLVEFGPVKHGKYKDTMYQETYVYDIVSHTDALRHAVLHGDLVLAPWKPDGESYGPGEVIEGQEARGQEGFRDQPLVVHFFNGETATIPRDTAVWIPQLLHERVKFELQLPSKVRQEFREQSMYPEENLPGYPTSGVRATPAEYPAFEPAWIPGDSPVRVPAIPHGYTPGGVYHPGAVYPPGGVPLPLTRGGYYRYSVPRYPEYYPYPYETRLVPHQQEEDQPSGTIPGTDLTKDELSEKVMSQIMQNKSWFEREAEENTKKLLQRRETMEENSLKKSVTFDKDTALTDLEAEFDSGDLDFRDSGCGSAEDIRLGLSDGEGETETRDAAVGTDMSFAKRRRPKSRQGKKQPWKYWNGDPAPDLMDPMHYGPYRVGPYEPWLEPVPLERRCIQRGEFDAGWTSSQSQFVDPQACVSRSGPTVADTMQQWPRPPRSKPPKQGPGEEVGEALGKHMSEQESRFQQRQEFRRSHALERESRVVIARDDEFLGQKMMSDQHHQRIMAQLDHQRQRQLDEIAKVENQREAKKQVNEQLRARISDYQQREQEREGSRYDRMRATREQREQLAAQKQQEHIAYLQKRQEAVQQRVADREASFASRLAEQEASMSQQDVRARNAKLNRREHFRKLEADGQRQRNLLADVKSQQYGILRSQVFPTADVTASTAQLECMKCGVQK